MTGPLVGMKIVELAGVGPAPFAGMMLADNGAEVVRVERPGVSDLDSILNRSKHVIAADLKTPQGITRVRALCREADGLIEGFRPGVLERLGLKPEELLQDNPRLVIGRMTGWGQEGPLAKQPGHDINYIALAGNLYGYGRAGEKPTPPINAVGDFGGGGMLMAFGMVSAILFARSTGIGQVVDCAMVDGAAVLSAMTWDFFAKGVWRDDRGVNMIDTGSHFYEVYETADAKFVALGAIEPQFYARFCELVGLADDPALAAQMEPQSWPRAKEKLHTLFKTRSRDEWANLLERAGVCFAPVLSMAEAPTHHHNVARGTFIEIGNAIQPAPAPRFSHSKNAAPRPAQPIT